MGLVEGLPQPVSQHTLRFHTAPSYSWGIHPGEILEVSSGNSQRAEFTGEFRAFLLPKGMWLN